MNYLKAYNALNVIALTPSIQQHLKTHDPQALNQVREALKPVAGPGDDAVTVATKLLAERIENISANFGLCPALYAQTELCNGHGFIQCRMRTKEEAVAFRDFAKVFLHASAAIEESGHPGYQVIRVIFSIDEDNA